MKKLGLVVFALGAATVQATAADLARRPVVAPAPIIVPAFSWTGFYVGANLGGAWSSTTVTSNITGANWKPSNTTFIGGGQLGYNYQWPGSNWVIGAEWTFDWGGGEKTSNVVTGPNRAPVAGLREQRKLANNSNGSPGLRRGSLAGVWQGRLGLA